MLKKHKNRIYDQIVESGYRPEQFELSEGLKAFVDNEEYAQFGIKLRDTNLVFYVLIAPHSFDFFRYQLTLFAPDWPVSVVAPPRSFVEIEQLIYQFSIWLRGVVGRYFEEREVPDYWADLQAKFVEPQSVSLHEDVVPTKFTVREHEKVVVTLDVIKGLLIAYAKENEHVIHGIAKDIGELKERAKEQDRKSFFNQVVGYLINTATSMALAPDQMRALFEKLKQGFETLVKFLH